jgi:hypothetical protein
MAGEGLERLGYYNGQRLEALDYQLEQRYHIDARRMLNRGLFSPGVASGFVVEKVAGETRKVRVRQGAALDPVGREVILLDDVLVDVPNQQPTEGPGYLLTARYSEAAVEGGDPWCSGPTGAPRPARIREEIVLKWSENAPDSRRCQSGSEGLDCGVLLALVTLTPSCELDAIFTGVREYARPTHISQVQPFSFEGEKDIDKDNPKRLRFNINGVPASVRLYLWGDRFSTLYYTELGQHSHSFDLPTGPAESLDTHSHTLSAHTHTAFDAPAHRHRVWRNLRDQQNGPWNPGFGLVSSSEGTDFNWGLGGATGQVFYGYDDADSGPPPNRYQGVGAPADAYPRTPFIEDKVITNMATKEPTPDTTGPITEAGSERHRHVIPNTAPFGATDFGARGPHENSYGFLNNLRVGLRVQNITTDITDAIVTPLRWTSLGTGNPDDPLNKDGTGEIDLLAIANEKKIDLSLPGTYELTFSVADGGGKVAYNLFVA